MCTIELRVLRRTHALASLRLQHSTMSYRPSLPAAAGRVQRPTPVAGPLRLGQPSSKTKSNAVQVDHQRSESGTLCMDIKHYSGPATQPHTCSMRGSTVLTRASPSASVAPVQAGNGCNRGPHWQVWIPPSLSSPLPQHCPHAPP